MNVAITGVHAGCQRSPGLAVARSLACGQQCRLLAIDYDDLSTGLHSPEFSRFEVMPWTSEPSLLLERLGPVLRKHATDVILPCLNTDTLLLAEVAGDLAALGIGSCLPSVTSFRKVSKINLPSLAIDLGLLHPQTVVCEDADDFEGARSVVGLPCVLKGHECGVFPVRSVDLFGHYATYCTRCFDFPLLVQEWIEGEEFAVMGLCSRDSELLSSLVVKKLGIGDDGECWMSTVVEKEELVEVLRSVVNAAQWVGPIECDFILSEQGLYLLECNPRFPSWVDGPASLGFNIPLQAVRIAHDLDCVDLPRPATGTVFYKDFQDLCLPASSCTSA